MKKLSLIAAAVFTSAVFAQTTFPANPPPDASGPGRFVTQEFVGRIISVNRPITKRIVVGQECIQPQVQQYQQQNQNSSVNAGTIIGAIAGGIIGNQVGGGQGKTAATAVGAVTGAMVGNNINQQQNNQYGYTNQPQQCHTVWDEQIVGWAWTAEYQHLQMEGSSIRQPKVGDNVTIVVRSVYYAGMPQK